MIDRAARERFFKEVWLLVSATAWIRYQDKLFQGMNNNLYGNNPGEIDRWCDDGGR